MKSYKILFCMLIALSLMSVNAFSATLDTDTFGSDLEGWTGSGVSYLNSSKKMQIATQSTASKSYSASSYPNQSVTLTLTLEKDGTWEADDTIIITINGTVGYYSNTSGTITLNGVLDDNGDLDVAIKANTNAVQEKLIVDDITLATGYTYDSSSLRNFEQSYTANSIGDMQIIGNSVVYKADTGDCAPVHADNNGYVIAYADKDSDATTVNSTSADLILPVGVNKIKYAALYWQGRMRTSAMLEDGRDVKIKLNGDINYQTITANPSKFNWITQSITTIPTIYSGPLYSYQGIADITAQLQADVDKVDSAVIASSGYSGTLWVADVITEVGMPKELNGFGAWSMVVVYEDSAKVLRNFSVYDGYLMVQNSTVSQTLSGFFTPSSGAVNSKFLLFGGEGDFGQTDTVTLTNKSGTAEALGTNVFQSTITDVSGANISTRNPACANAIGADIHTFDIGTSGTSAQIIENGQTSTVISITSTSDGFFPGTFAFATDVYQPNLCYIENIFKGTTNMSGTGVEVNADDNLTVRVYLKNTGNEVAENVQIQHQFDTDFSYVANSANYNNSNPAYETVMPPLGYTRTTASDSSGNDLYEYSGATLLSKINLGVGANSSSGGTFNPNSTFAVFEYNATVKAMDSNYTNVYKVGYKNSALGIDYTATPVTLSTCDGSSNSFFAIVSDPIVGIGFDARETSISMADDNRSITTKIANKPISLNVVSLDTSGALGTYQGIDNNRVYLFSVDTSVCSLSESERLSAIASKPRTTYVTFMQNDTNHVSPNFTETVAGKDKKIMMNFINWSQEFIDAAFNCSNSNTQAVLNGVPQCLNSDSKLTQIFPNLVTECLLAGARPACQSSSYASSGLPSPPYDNEFGCYQCLAGGAGATTCSTDNFAIRPDRFEFTPPLSTMKAGEDYNMTVFAKNFNSTVNTTDYNQTVSNLKGAPKSWWNRDAATQIMTVNTQGTTTINGAWNLANGTGSVPIRFSDVGKFTLDLNDTDWAAVDADDSSLSERTLNGDGNVTFIPWDFNISVGTIANNDGASPSFTYLSRDLNMSARIPMSIRAQNKQGAITQNYANNLYDRNITITPYVSSTTATARGLTPITRGVTNADGNFTSGTTTILFNDPLVARFNFDRNQTVAVSPFDVNSSNGVGNDVNVSVSDTDLVYGDKNQTLNNNATFVYGRFVPRDVRVFGANTAFTANGWYEVFNAPTIGTTGLAPSKNGSGWYINTLHSDQLANYDGDANVTYINTTLQVPNIGGAVGTDGMEDYNFGATTLGSYKAHINTDPWLWYGPNASPYVDPSSGNTNCLTHPCFNINVVPAVGASGSAKTDATGDKANKKSDSSAGNGGFKSTNDYAPAVR